MQRQLKPYLLALSCVLVLTPAARAEEHHRVVFTTIDPPGAGGDLVEANGINRNGDIVGAYFDTTGTAHGYLLSQGTFAIIDFPGAIYTASAAINAHGDIVGIYQLAPGRTRGYLLSQGEFTSIEFPGAAVNTAFGINARGDIVGQYRTVMGGAPHAYVLSGGIFTTIDFPGAIGTTPFNINASVDIVGWYQSADLKVHVFRLSGGEFTTIDFPGAVETAFPGAFPHVGINAGGNIVGSYCDAEPCPVALTDSFENVHGFLLTERERDEGEDGEFRTIDFPGAIGTLANGIGPRGDIVGAYKDASGTFHGFLRTRERHERDRER
jgi:hypothetical protein